MKRTFHSPLQVFRAVEHPTHVYDILKTSRPLTTYNQLMSHYSNGERDIGIVLVAPAADPMHAYLPLFCRFHKIDLYALPDDAEAILSSLFGRKYVSIACVSRKDPAYPALASILSSPG